LQVTPARSRSFKITPMSRVDVLTRYRRKHSVYFGSLLVHGWYSLGTPVYQSSKTVKRQSKQQKWPLVYQSSHVYTESAEYTKRPTTTSSPPWPVAEVWLLQDWVTKRWTIIITRLFHCADQLVNSAKTSIHLINW